jgi:hypothetical protein
MTQTTTEPRDERRTHRRLSLEKPCKVYDPRSRKYYAGTTCNLSTHGILLKVPRPLGVQPDDHILVGVAMDDRQAFIETRELIDMIVVRTLRTWEGGTMMAVRVSDAEAPMLRLAA